MTTFQFSLFFILFCKAIVQLYGMYLQRVVKKQMKLQPAYTGGNLKDFALQSDDVNLLNKLNKIEKADKFATFCVALFACLIVAWLVIKLF